jgi:acetyl-CoA carboxylase biotin carboxylase subunit
MPSPGKITRLRIPQGPGVRDDGGVYESAEVSIYYDPMISKFAVYGRDRNEAIDRMRRALMEYQIGGIKTTIPFFRQVMEDAEFIEGKLDTAFITRFNERQVKTEPDESIRDIAAIAAILESLKKPEAVQADTSENSKWRMSGRLAAMNDR